MMRLLMILVMMEAVSVTLVAAGAAAALTGAEHGSSRRQLFYPFSLV